MTAGTAGQVRGMVFAALVFACFSTGDAVVKWVTAGYSVFQITCVASVFSLLPVAGLVACTGGWASLRPRHPLWVGVRTLMLVGESLLCYYAFSRLPLGEVYPLIFVTPLLVPLLAIPLLGEKVGWRRLLAVFVAFLGVLIVLRPGFRQLDAGHLAALSSTLLFSLGMIILKWLDDENYGALLVSLMVGKIVVAGGFMMATGMVPMSAADLGLMALIGLLSGTAHCFLVLAIRHAPASVVSPFQYTQELWGILYGWVLFDSVLDGPTMAGAGVIIGAGFMIVRRPRPAGTQS